MYRLTVLREMPRRPAISRNETWSRSCQRRIPARVDALPGNFFSLKTEWPKAALNDIDQERSVNKRMRISNQCNPVLIEMSAIGQPLTFRIKPRLRRLIMNHTRE